MPIDLDALALLAPPHGEGTVSLRTSLFLDLLAEVRSARAVMSFLQEMTTLADSVGRDQAYLILREIIAEAKARQQRH